MARALRMDYPDTWYHVLSRGNERRDIFYDERDYRKFLDSVGRMGERFGTGIPSGRGLSGGSWSIHGEVAGPMLTGGFNHPL
ncbi:MAG: hypothetical protein GTO12_01260 [Proteobacteria bacterium]|nr:hypothetical protein [Pseudomonadota bacterium]